MISAAAALNLLALCSTALAVPAKRQAGPLVYAQGSQDQSGAVTGSSTYIATPVGCYSDQYPYVRTLNGSYFFEPTYTTPETCALYCANLGYLYSGTEYYTQCFCGNGLDGSVQLDASACDAPCQANPDEICGGSNALSLQSISYSYSQGCFEDIVNYRSLTGPSYSSPDMTIETCTAYCSKAGYSLAGLEYADECYCGNELRLGPSNNCNMACSGNSAETCGGGNALSVYAVNYQSIVSPDATVQTFGCYADFYPDSRALDGPSISTGDLTNERCQAYCTAQGFPYSGTEYNHECYCGSTAPTVTSTGCDLTCAGDETEICGGNNALSVLYYGAALPVAAASPQVVNAPYSNTTTTK